MISKLLIFYNLFSGIYLSSVGYTLNTTIPITSNQQCTAFDVGSFDLYGLDTDFKFYIPLKEPTGLCNGTFSDKFKIFSEKSEEDDISTKCEFEKNASIITCSIKNKIKSVLSGKKFTINVKTSGFEFDCLCNNTESSCYFPEMESTKEVNYSVYASVLSAKQETYQVIDLNNSDSYFNISFDYLDYEYPPGAILNDSSVVSCDVPKNVEEPLYLECTTLDKEKYDIKQGPIMRKVYLKNDCDNIESTNINIIIYDTSVNGKKNSTELINEFSGKGNLKKKSNNGFCLNLSLISLISLLIFLI